MDKMRHANVRKQSAEKNVKTILETRAVLTDLSRKKPCKIVEGELKP